jgi:hypothetical protein
MLQGMDDTKQKKILPLHTKRKKRYRPIQKRPRARAMTIFTLHGNV